jgi:hypothetical protein
LGTISHLSAPFELPPRSEFRAPPIAMALEISIESIQVYELRLMNLIPRKTHPLNVHRLCWKQEKTNWWSMCNPP